MEGTQSPQLLYPSLKREPANLSGNFSSTCSRFPQIRVITKHTKMLNLSHHFNSFLAPPNPLNPIHCNELMTRLLENSCTSPPILMIICRNILAIEYFFIGYESTSDLLQGGWKRRPSSEIVYGAQRGGEGGGLKISFSSD
ncbi:hypothetical protein AVEN_190757-1 [Araneus ventricosus]|uniref:Uncharacterized protein n=1 Tax=Araneus ventricosus TaxID=182803 RepID=A0A4Y2HSQ3_ARAVE|nr:hypothetical protein AVEN_190757-1 [Araneus ventricosus]